MTPEAIADILESTQRTLRALSDALTCDLLAMAQEEQP